MFVLGKRDWARSHNQVVIVHCLVELFLHFASSTGAIRLPLTSAEESKGRPSFLHCLSGK